MTRLPLLIALIVAVTVTSSLSAGASPRHSRTCDRRGAITLAATARSRIYRHKKDRTHPGYPDGPAYTTMVCWAPRDLRLAIDDPNDIVANGPFALAGRYAAFASAISDNEQVGESVSVADISRLHGPGSGPQEASDSPYETDTPGVRDADLARVFRIAVTARGTAAWTSRTPKGYTEVATLDVHRHRQILDVAPTIHVRSLQLHSHTLTWRDGQTTRQATIY